MALLSADAALVGGSSFGASATVGWSAGASLAGSAGLSAVVNIVTGYAAPVNYLPPARSVVPGKVVFDQVDWFLGDGKTRAQDVTISDLELRVYVGGSQLNWSLISGSGIPDVRVTSGKVYWTEFSAGFYSVRFFPNLVGLWRIVLTYPTHNQAISLTYDVAPAVSSPGVGVRASFSKRG